MQKYKPRTARTKEIAKKRNATRRQPKKSRKRGVVLLLLVLVVSAGAVYGLFYSSYFSVTHVKINAQNISSVNTLVQDWLSTKQGSSDYLSVASNNIFLLSTNSLKQQLAENSEYEHIEIHKQLPNKLVIQITERKPNIVYHRDNRNYLLDQQGNTVKTLGVENSQPHLPLVLGTSTDVFLETQDTERVQTIIAFIDTITREFPKHFSENTITHFTLLHDSYDLQAHTNDSWYVFFNAQLDSAIQLSNLTRVFNEKVTEKEKRNLQYIDVRIEQYVYYK